MKIEQIRILKVKPKKIRPINYCRECNRQLGFFLNEAGRKCYWFSEKPYIVNTIEYYRSLCIDCFKEKYNRLPVNPNVVNKDMPILLQIPDDIFNSIKSARFEHNHFTRKARQVQSTTQKYITSSKRCKKTNIIGDRNSEEWRKFLAYKNTYEYKKEKYGWTREQFDAFNKSRAITLPNLIKKYGKELGTKKYNEYCEKQRKNGNTLEYFIEKYGELNGPLEYKRVNSLKAITLKNMKRIHGDIDGIKAYEKWLNADRLGSKYYSPISQELFWILYEKLENKDEIKFGEYNKEQFLWTDNIPFAYDFKYKNKIIEFNGEHCHPNKEKLTDTEFQKWKCCFTGKSGIEKWEEDMLKISTAKNRGFKVLILWYYDYINDKENTIKRALEFLQE